MSDLSYKEINSNVLDALRAPPLIYYGALAVLGTGFIAFLLVWLYQMETGMGVTGISHPTGWGVYIANFVFWVGIAHSGTLISAILFLVRARFRDAVSRSAEAMTIFAIAIAGLFPLVHLGRFWVFYYILPYPSGRQIWPNFLSPLLWDVMAIMTYLTVSVIFFFVGLIPDLASAREYFKETKGDQHPRTKLYRFLSFGWHGSASQWRHYGRSYLYFAALATPLVISVHSVVSWDFAMSLLPGWHSTLFAPYFVAGAIHSGLAMVLVLLIPLRKLLRLERMIEIYHFERVAQTLLVTTAIVGYSYIVLPFIAWNSGDIFERQFEFWRATGPWAWAYWGVIILNVLIPASFAFRKFRRNLKWLFTVGIIVVAGMWIERFLLIPTPMMHDFLPHNWGSYTPTWVEITITGGSFCLFFFLFTAFSKSLPTVPLSDVKTQTANKEISPEKIKYHSNSLTKFDKYLWTITASFSNAGLFTNEVNRLLSNKNIVVETYTPQRIAPLLQTLGLTRSPVRWWTFLFGVIGAMSGYALTIYCALVNHLIVGGKHPISIIPYTIIAFEFTILFGSIANLIAFIFYTHITNRKKPIGFNQRFSLDRFGVVVQCGKDELDLLRHQFVSSGAVQTDVLSPEVRSS